MTKPTPSTLASQFTLLRAGLALGLLALASCSTKASGVCDGDSPAPECGAPCAGQADCGNGTYCDPNGACTSECTPGGGECGEGFICSATGQCQDATCASIDLQVDSVTPSIELVIDRSGSMAWDFSGSNQNPPAGTSRWAAIKDALIGNDQALLPTLQNRIYFGALLYFYNTNVPSQHLQTIESPRALGTSAAIATMLNNTSPSGGTPTSLAVSRAVTRFDEVAAPADSPKYILLVTDGTPTVPGTASTEETNGSLTVASIEAAKQAGITTLVLGVSAGIAAENLQRFANAGQGLAPDGTEKADYAVATSAADLVDDLSGLLGAARSCDLTLQGAIEPTAAASGTVTLNGVALSHSTDWNVIDNTTLRLVGAACDTFLDSPAATISANFPCDAVIAVF